MVIHSRCPLESIDVNDMHMPYVGSKRKLFILHIFKGVIKVKLYFFHRIFILCFSYYNVCRNAGDLFYIKSLSKIAKIEMVILKRKPCVTRKNLITYIKSLVSPLHALFFCFLYIFLFLFSYCQLGRKRHVKQSLNDSIHFIWVVLRACNGQRFNELNDRKGWNYFFYLF